MLTRSVIWSPPLARRAAITHSILRLADEPSVGHCVMAAANQRQPAARCLAVDPDQQVTRLADMVVHARPGLP
jgi:hypothetical protein